MVVVGPCVGAVAAVAVLFEALVFVVALFEDAVAVGAVRFDLAVSDRVVVGAVVGGPAGLECSG
ncbi:MAG: hypothetical protein L0G94_11670, partial [Brachybacterium sp.]|uniref:hypothetical protein n=1 Tax=Brachybacterium sp. TaxID=1891286 RepID=UPI002648B819